MLKKLCADLFNSQLLSMKKLNAKKGNSSMTQENKKKIKLSSTFRKFSGEAITKNNFNKNMHFIIKKNF